jgi:hypothetical protein
LGTFWHKIEQFWPFAEISIFNNSGHLEWRAGLSDTILKGNHPGTIPARFGLIWFRDFRGEDLNVIFYQNMPNLHNRYISAERKISQKNPGIADFDRLCKLEKRRDEKKKKSSPRKLLSQYQPNFVEMILGWAPSKIVSVDPDFQPRWPPSSK